MSAPMRGLIAMSSGYLKFVLSRSLFLQLSISYDKFGVKIFRDIPTQIEDRTTLDIEGATTLDIEDTTMLEVELNV